MNPNRYTIGEPVRLEFQIPVDPDVLALTVMQPDGLTVDAYAISDLTHPALGYYYLNYAAAVPGLYGWRFESANPSSATEGTFVVVGSSLTSDITATSAAPRTTLCQPWISVADVQRRPHMNRIEPEDLAISAQAASEVLYLRSGRQFSGLGTTTVRPTMQPYERSMLAVAAFFGQYGYLSQGTWSPLGLGWASQGWGSARQPAAVDLGVYPLVSVQQVKINGTVIPSNEYRIDDSRWLVRTRPTAQTQPTERYGWPSTQNLELPDTEPGTFSVSCTYGTPPPQMGKIGAAALAAYLAQLIGRPATGATLPARATSVSRAGVTVALADAVAALGQGMLGIPEADLFVHTMNPGGLTRRPSVWSPDIGTVRRAGV